MRHLHLPGTLKIAFKLLVNDRTKFAALLVGITFAVFLMIEMTSLFSGILSRASSTVINIGASIWVMDPAVQTVANTIPVGNLLSSNGRAWSVGADASAPLFQGGSLWYKRKAAMDNYRQAEALYRQTVLAAFAQVADTLRALEHDAAALKAEDRAQAAAEQALKLVQANYAAGLGTYLDVLAADAHYHQAKINDLQSIAVRYQDTVALYVALGGGWWDGPPPGPGIAARTSGRH